jgi:hypothetical protein
MRYGGHSWTDITDENVLVFNVPNEALERAAGVSDGPAWTLNFCTYNYYQCGPIGSPT